MRVLKEKGGGASSGQGMVVVMLATALLLPTVGGWLPSTLAALSRPSPSVAVAAAAALGTSMHMCWHKGGAGRGDCGRGGVLWCHMTELILSPTFLCLV
jgi:hypothetical protein